MTAITPEVAFAIPSELGEGALWDVKESRLLWVDIVLQKLYEYDPRNGSNLAYHVGQSVGTVVLTEQGQALLGLRHSITLLDRVTGRLRPICEIEATREHTRLNDGKCDPMGRFWVGSICEREPHFDGGLYCLDENLELTQKLAGIQCSNGLVWTRDASRFYYVDTPTQEIWGFLYDAQTGNLTEKAVVATIPRELGCPDGMTIDSEDQLWVALWEGGRVVRVDPRSGQVTLEVPVPALNVTSVAFGGPNLDELYITTARAGMSPEARQELPLSGSLFRAKVPFHGVPATRYRGNLCAR